MTKVEIVCSQNAVSFQELINDFLSLSSIVVKDIKFIIDSDNYIYAMIIYEEPKKWESNSD
jgi:hypothetical protein